MPAPLTIVSFPILLSFNAASSIFLSSTLSVPTSMLTLLPSTIKSPVTLRSPSTSKVYSGRRLVVKIPTLAVPASTYTASTI